MSHILGNCVEMHSFLQRYIKFYFGTGGISA